MSMQIYKILCFLKIFQKNKYKKTKLEDVPFGCDDHKEGGKKKHI